MEIRLPDDEHTDTLILSDEEFDGNGWLTLRIGDKSIDVHIDDLMPAIGAFQHKFDRQE